LQKIRQEFSDYIESTKLYETREEWKSKLSGFKITELLDNIKTSVEENKEKLIELNKNREGFEIKRFKVEIEKHVKEYICRVQSRAGMVSHIQKRLLTAFPNIKFASREDALKDLRERLLKYKRK
jgi:LPS O-antigen subunit length determinant protein (WzzB/FepE family)